MKVWGSSRPNFISGIFTFFTFINQLAFQAQIDLYSITLPVPLLQYARFSAHRFSDNLFINSCNLFNLACTATNFIIFCCSSPCLSNYRNKISQFSNNSYHENKQLAILKQQLKYSQPQLSLKHILFSFFNFIKTFIPDNAM